MAFASRIDGISRICALAVIVIATSLSVASLAAAQTATDDPQLEAGHQLLRTNRCDEAATAFRAAWENGRRPRALAELGLAEACLSRWIEAEVNLAQALATPDEWVTRNRATLDESLEQVRAHLGTLVVDVVGPSADETEVHIDGRLRGRAGQDIRVVAGAVVVEVRAAGYEQGRRSLEVARSQRTRERFELVRVAEAGGTDPSPSGPSTPIHRSRPRTSEGGGSSLRLTLGWMGIGLAAAAVGVGFAGLAVRETNLETWNDDALCNSIPGLDRDQECASEGDGWRLGEALMWVGFVGGGLLATGGVLLLVTGSSSSREEPSPRVSLGCAPAPGGVTCSLRVW